MKKHLHTEIEIDAAADRVWDVLTDFASYPEWNPFIVAAAGRPATGERLTLRMQPPGGRAMTFRPVVREAQPCRRLRWLGRFLLPGLFDGEHVFSVEPLAEGRVRLVQEERFRGLLVRPLSRSL